MLTPRSGKAKNHTRTLKNIKQFLQRFYNGDNRLNKVNNSPSSKPIQVDKKDTFLRYTQDTASTGSTGSPLSSTTQRLKPRQISPGKLSVIDQLKLKLLKSIDAASAKNALDELFALKAYEEISLTLRKKNADLSFYKYISKKALAVQDYRLALRLVKDLKKPIVYQDIIETIVQNKDYEALTPAIQSIEAYIRYYHRMNVVEANIYKHYAYAFAALAGAKNKAYTFAFDCAKQMGRCSYVWVDLVTIIAQNQDFWEVERFAESAEHLRDNAYTTALAYCEAGSAWAEVFSEKCKQEALAP